MSTGLFTTPYLMISTSKVHLKHDANWTTSWSFVVARSSFRVRFMSTNTLRTWLVKCECLELFTAAADLAYNRTVCRLPNKKLPSSSA
jgi:hypothetical protein